MINRFSLIKKELKYSQKRRTKSKVNIVIPLSHVSFFTNVSHI